MQKKFIITAIVFALPAFFLGRVIWPDPAGAIALVGIQLPLFIILSALEASLFAIGIAFLVFGWSMVRQTTQNRSWTTAVFLAITWALISWWPHDNMHRANGENIWGLLRIEYIFHFSLYIVALILARYFWKVMTGCAGKTGRALPSL